MNTKLKGDIGQLIVAQDLLRKGWQVSFPYGENCRYDLIVEKEGIFRRIQVKAVSPRDGALKVNCRSSNNWSVHPYSDKDFEYLAAVNLNSNEVYYISSKSIGKNLFNLRLEDSKNGQAKRINLARNFTDF